MVNIEQIQRAAERIEQSPKIVKTPVEKSSSLGDETGAEVYLKFEHLQKTGSFKTRGAFNKISQLDSDSVSEVVAASAGNHAQGVAFAATELGIDSHIVMPETAPQTKIDATEGYGAEVELHGNTFSEAMKHAKSYAEERGEFIHAYDDPDIVAGQGTIGLELQSQIPGPMTVVVPIGGGGLIGGISTALKSIADDVKIIGVQADGAATVPQSLNKGHPVDIENPDTIADGIATGNISELTFNLISEHVDTIVTVTDTEIAEATLWLLERNKQLVEGAAATTVAALLSGKVESMDRTVVPILCGGNIDISTLQDVLTRALVDRRQFVTLYVRIDDQPGVLGEISKIIGDHDTNIRSVRHDRTEEELPVGKADLVFRLTTPGDAAMEQVISDITEAGYVVRKLVPS